MNLDPKKIIPIEINRDIRINYDSIVALLKLDDELKNLEFCNCAIKPKTPWFDGELCSLLSAILTRRREQNSLSLTFDFSETNNGVVSILMRNGFFAQKSINDINNTIIPVKSFDRIQNEAFIDYIKEHFIGNKFPFPKNFTQDIKNALAEIFSNCEIHSETKKVYSAGQYFPQKGKNGLFSFCLTDLGIGIPTLVKNKRIGQERTSEDAIRWAFEKSNTTIEDRPGGLGLNSLKEKALQNNGQLIVVSRDIYFDATTDVCQYLPFDFEGTSVILTLNCQG